MVGASVGCTLGVPINAVTMTSVTLSPFENDYSYTKGKPNAPSHDKVPKYRLTPWRG